MSDPKKPQTSKGAVLVISGAPDGEAALIAELKGAGYETSLCESGNHAFNLVETRPRGWQPALFIVDVIVPGSSGFDIVRRIVAKFSIKKIPVAMMAQNPSGEDRVEASSAGAIGLLKKPVTLKAIQEALEKAQVKR